MFTLFMNCESTAKPSYLIGLLQSGHPNSRGSKPMGPSALEAIGMGAPSEQKSSSSEIRAG